MGALEALDNSDFILTARDSTGSAPRQDEGTGNQDTACLNSRVYQGADKTSTSELAMCQRLRPRRIAGNGRSSLPGAKQLDLSVCQVCDKNGNFALRRRQYCNGNIISVKRLFVRWPQVRGHYLISVNIQYSTYWSPSRYLTPVTNPD